MIAIDSSALIAIVLGEPEGQRCTLAIDQADRIIISGATLTETLIVALGRGVESEMHSLLGRIRSEVISVDE